MDQKELTIFWKVRLLGAMVGVRVKVRIMNSPLSTDVESEIGKTSYGENLGRRRPM